MELRFKNLITEINRFSSNLTEKYPSVNDDDLVFFESKYSIKLPNDFVKFLHFSNGFSLMGEEIYGIRNKALGDDMISVYNREHFLVVRPQPLHLVPFSQDGRGNFYCFDCSKISVDGDSCPIIFWTSNYEYTENVEPEITHPNFNEFVQECFIDWTLEDYDYSGEKK